MRFLIAEDVEAVGQELQEVLVALEVVVKPERL
jgi:hypothetical protein